MSGRPLTRREDERILRGRSRYLDDIEPPGCLHMAFVRSPLAHARIISMEVPRELPGEARVLTAQALEGRVRPVPVMTPEGATLADEPHPVLAASEVRYMGQAVAAVVAASRALAEDAAELVQVDYEPLDPIAQPRKASSTTSATGGTMARGSAGRRSSARWPGTASVQPSGSAAARRRRSCRSSRWERCACPRS